MKIKVGVNSINRIIDPKYSIEKLYNQLKGLSDKTGLVFGDPSVGSGQLQWTLEGEGWTAFSDLDDSLKPQASVLFNDRKKVLQEALGGASLSNEILTLPDEKFLFFRDMESQPEIGLTCWGYRYPDFKDGMELETWVKKAHLQDVAISFSWDGQKLAYYNFIFHSYRRRTDSDGVFKVDQPLPIGNTYTVESLTGRKFTLTVIEGQQYYDFDVTEYFTVEISVKKDEEPLPDKELTLKFNGESRQIKCDSSGNASLRLPLECSADGLVKQPQSACDVLCGDKTESQTPSEINDELFYIFQFPTPVVDEEIEVPPPPPEEDKEPKKPQMIGITVLDYGGYPVKEMEVTLIIPKKKEEKFVTDDEGRIEFPKDWLQGKKKKFKVRFTASAEYQKTHDLHLHEVSKKENKQP